MVSKGKEVAGKDWSAKRKRDEDSDKTGRRKRNNPGVLQFFDDAAEVDEDESSDDDLDDFLEDEFDTEAKVKKEPGKSHNVPFFPKEEEMSEEELEKYLEERYRPGSSFVRYAEDGYESKRPIERSAAVPSAKDPTVWKVKCMAGRERHSAFCLMQKFVEMHSLGSKLQIFSAFSLDHVKGFIYIEADKQFEVNEACKGLASIYSSRVSPVPKNEVSHLLSVRSKFNEVSAGTWARVKNGKYKGDLAQVMAMNHARKKATVKLIPRVDLQLMAEKFGGGVTPKKTATPAPRLISSSELEDFRPLIQYRRDRDTGEMLEILDGLMFKDGFIYKKVSIDSLSFWAVTPSEDEVLKFRSSKKEESGDLEWLSQLYGDQKKTPTMKVDKGGGKGGKGGKGEKGECSSSSGMASSFEVNDLVFFGKKRNCGVIIGTEKDDMFKILKEGSGGPEVVNVEQRDLKNMSFDKRLTALDRRKKSIFINDTVRVLEGPLEGRQGIVKQIYGGTVFLYDENELENSGYLCLKSQMCEKIKRSDVKCSGKDEGGESEPLGFDDFPSSPKTPLSPKKPSEERENNRNFNREDKDGMYSVGQALRIRVGPLKGYICRVLAVRRSDVTVKLDSQQKVLTVKSDHLSEVRAKSSVIPLGEDSESVKPFNFLGTQDSSTDWMDGAATSADGGNWAAGGLSTERSSWPSFPASSFSLQPESNSANPSVDNEGKKDVGDASWESQVAPRQNSSWGTAVADAKAVEETQDGGWKKAEGSWKKDTTNIDMVGGASDSWSRPKISTGDQAGSSADAGDIWGKAKVGNGTQDKLSNDIATSWGKNNRASNDGWKKSEEKTPEIENSGTENAMSGWNNASTGKNQQDTWSRGEDGGSGGSTWGKAAGSTNESGQQDSWGKAAPVSTGKNQLDAWGKGKDGGSGGSTWGNAVGSQEKGTNEGVQQDSWGKAATASTGKNKLDAWGKDKDGGSGGSTWGNAVGSQEKGTNEGVQQDSWGKAATASTGKNTLDAWGKDKDGGSGGSAWGKAVGSQEKGTNGGVQEDTWGKAAPKWTSKDDSGGSKADWNRSTAAPENQDQTDSWNKQKVIGADGGANSWGKATSGSKAVWNCSSSAPDNQGQTESWNKPKAFVADGGSSWTKQGGGPSGNRENGGSSWSKQADGDADEGRSFDGGRGFGGRRGRGGGRGGRGQFGRGRSFGQGESSTWSNKGQENYGTSSGTAAEDQPSWNSGQGGWNEAKAFDGGSGGSSNVSKPFGSSWSSGWNKGSTAKEESDQIKGQGDGWNTGNTSKEDQGSDWKNRSGSADHGGGWNKRKAPEGDDLNNIKPLDGGSASGWGQSSNWKSKANDAGGDQDRGWGNKSNWNSGNAFGGSGSSDAGGNQDSWGNKSKWNSENASGGSENQFDTFDNRGTGGGNWRGGRGGRFGGRGGSDRGGFGGRGGSDRGGFGGRGGSDRGGFGGRGDSDGGGFGGRGGYRGGFRGRGGSDRGDFGGRGRGRRDQSSDWNNRNDSGEDKPYSWTGGSNNNAEGWKSSGGSWNQGGGNSNADSWKSSDGGGSGDQGGGNKGPGQSWSKGTLNSGGGGWNSKDGGGSWKQGGNESKGQWQTGNSGWNPSNGSGGTKTQAVGSDDLNKGPNSSGGWNKESSSGNGGAPGAWNQSNAAGAGGGQSSGSGSWNQSNAAGAGGGQSSGSGWNQSKDFKAPTSEGGGPTSSPAGWKQSTVDKKAGGWGSSGNGSASGSWNQSNAAGGGQSSGSGWNQSKDAEGAGAEGGGPTDSWGKTGGSSWGNKGNGGGGSGSKGGW